MAKEAQGRPDLGAKASDTARRAHWINNPGEHESHPGETLATRSHEVIKRWAEERNATPSTVPGTRHGDRLGVLRFDFPGYGGESLEHVPWEEWLRTFDERRLIFLFQEHLRDGRQSNFFKLDNPEREHE